MTNEESNEIVSFMTPGQGVLCQGVAIQVIKQKCIISFKTFFSTLGDGSDKHKKTFPLSLFDFIYSMMGLLIYKYEPFWHEVTVESLILIICIYWQYIDQQKNLLSIFVRLT